MEITKIGHCCMLIDVNNLRILTDPGAYTEKQNELTNIDVVLITHEHPDHLHIESLKAILVNNPNAKVITNNGVGEKLADAGIKYEVVSDQELVEISEVVIEGFGQYHAELYPSIVPVENTGYFINNDFFYPGDNLTNPKKQVKILALPVAGPWLKLSDAIDYAKSLKPEICFPVHDGMLKHLGSTHVLPEKELTQEGINFLVLEENTPHNF